MKPFSTLIKKNRLIILFFFIIPILYTGCDKEEQKKPDPCLVLVDGVFVYPPCPEDGWQTENIWEEQRKYFAIPDDVLKCISTEGLIQSILNHPNFKVMLFVYTTPVQGYGRACTECNGLSELAQRNDAMSTLFNRYKEMDPLDLKNRADTGAFMLGFYYLEIIMAQRVYFTKLSEEEKSVFFEFILDTYDKKIEAYPQYGISWGKLNLGIMARIMDYDKYTPFINEYESCYLLELMVQQLLLAYNNDCIPADIIYSHAKEYLKYLKGQKNE